MEKVLSISVAAYNVEKFIDQTIQSVVKAKKREDIQLMIINDGSTDNTLEIALDYERKYEDIIQVIDKENGGHGSTINRGIQEAVGKYFMVLDGDDWLDTLELDKILIFLENSNVDLVLLNSVNCYENGNIVKVVHFPDYRYDQEYKETEFGEKLQVGLSCAIIKTAIFKASELRCLEKCLYEDLQYDAILTFLAKNFIYKNFYLYQYRLGRKSQSVSMESFQRHIDMQLRVSDVLQKFYSTSSEKMCGGKCDSILNCWFLIEKTIMATYLSFKPSKEIKKKLNIHMSKIRNTDVERLLLKKQWSFRFYKISKMYYMSSVLYRLKKRICT